MRIVSTLVSAVSRKYHQKEAIYRLQRMSDRALCDIGIIRSDIPQVVRRGKR